ncbi:MAG: peptidase S24, partial [Sphingobium sp.]
MDESQNARIALDRLIAERGENYADLSRLIGRNPA